jgi:lipopolysaccharide biosynthesis regulator YciM
VVTAILVAAAYSAVATAEYLAAHFSEEPDLASLQRAVRLQPGNADYRYRVGRFLLLVEKSPEAAAQAYRSAIALDPHQARYWLNLAEAYQLLGKVAEQADALERAMQADPKTPDVAWETGNAFLVRGETERAMEQFRVVLASDSSMAPAALQLCWRINPNTEALLRDVLPPNSQVHLSFLGLLMAKKETAGTAKVWAQLSRLQQRLPVGHVFDYIRYLISQREADQAGVVWRDAASLCGLSAYQPSSENLVVNGDFSLDVLNGGFDWLYRKMPGVSLSIDPKDFHTGPRSLSIVLDTKGIDDAGIHQMILVEPNKDYEFSAYFKAEDMQGAGGLRLALQDLFDGTTYFASEDLKDADSWTAVSGRFTTGSQTKLLMLGVRRIPVGNAIRGKLWIDSVSLVQKEPHT